MNFHKYAMAVKAIIIPLPILLLLSNLNCAMAQTNVLDKTLTISFEKVSLSEALEDLEQVASVSFSYTPNALRGDRRVNNEYKDNTLREILNDLLVEYKILYAVRNNNILIRTDAEKGQVSGRVTKVDGDPVAFASVILKGTSYGASSDEEGFFDFNAPEGEYIIVASSVGFTTQQKPVSIASGLTSEMRLELQETSQDLNEVIVTGRREEGYIVQRTEALKLPIMTQKAPVSISVMSDELLEDLGARNIASVITYVPGLSNADNGGTNRENFRVRGFPQTQTFINGIRQSITTEGVRAIETVERLQIVKGTPGVEAALTSPGGFINIITKKPEDTFKAEAFVGGGDFNFFRIGGDVTGPLVKGKLNGRLIAAYQKKQFWRDGQDDRPVVTIAPSLAWNISDKTQFVAEYEFSWQNDPLDRGVLYLEGAGLENNFVERTWTFHGNDDELKTENHRLDLVLNHKFTDNLSASLHYQRATQTSNEISFRNADAEGGFGPLFQEDGLTFSGEPIVPLFFTDRGSDLTASTVQLDISGNLYTGGVKHSFNLGGSLAKNEDIFTDENRDFIYGDFVNDFDVFNPNNDLEPNRLGEVVFPNFVRGDEINSVFAQILTEWSEKFRTVVGIRYDDVEVFAIDDIGGIGPEALELLEQDFAPGPIELFEEVYDDQLFSYRLGASYDLTKTLSGFIGFSSAGEPQPGVTRQGEGIEPIRSNSIDGGIKWDLFDGRALATASVYYLERQNIAIADPQNTPQENFLVPLGSAAITGFELELTGKLTKRLSFFGGFSIQDSEITESDDDIVGNRFANIPVFQGSGFVNYNGAGLGLKGLDLGLGMVHQGEREANSANEYQLPAYTRMDLALGYTFNNDLQIRANIFNLFDTTYYLAAQDSIFGVDQVAVGDRRLFQVTLTKRW